MKGRAIQLDLLKALAIVGVIAQHGLPAEQLRTIGGALHAGLAVPVFVIVTGLNLLWSARRHASGPALRDWYGRTWWERRLPRLLIPLAVAFAIGLALGLATDRLYLGPQTLVGTLPLPGPGDYYIPVVLQLVAIVPLAAWCYQQRPRLTVAALFAINIAFELACSQIDSLQAALTAGRHPIAYDACSLRYFGALALGLWIGDDWSLGARRNRWILLATVPAIAYLVIENHDPAGFPLFGPGFERRTNVFVVAYAAVLAMLALRLLPAELPDRPLARLCVLIGQASYHIFLVQIMWFGLVGETTATFVVALVGSITLGLAFHRLVPGRWPLRPRSSGTVVPSEAGAR